MSSLAAQALNANLNCGDGWARSTVKTTWRQSMVNPLEINQQRQLNQRCLLTSLPSTPTTSIIGTAQLIKHYSMLCSYLRKATSFIENWKELYIYIYIIMQIFSLLYEILYRICLLKITMVGTSIVYNVSCLEFKLETFHIENERRPDMTSKLYAWVIQNLLLFICCIHGYECKYLQVGQISGLIRLMANISFNSQVTLLCFGSIK